MRLDRRVGQILRGDAFFGCFENSLKNKKIKKFQVSEDLFFLEILYLSRISFAKKNFK